MTAGNPKKTQFRWIGLKKAPRRLRAGLECGRGHKTGKAITRPGGCRRQTSLSGNHPSSYERSLIPAREVPLTLGDLSQFSVARNITGALSSARHPGHSTGNVSSGSRWSAISAEAPSSFPEELVLLRQPFMAIEVQRCRPFRREFLPVSRVPIFRIRTVSGGLGCLRASVYWSQYGCSGDVQSSR